MRHHRQMLDHGGRIRRAPERSEAVLDGGEGVPRLHQEDTQEKLPVVFSHATSSRSEPQLLSLNRARLAVSASATRTI